MPRADRLGDGCLIDQPAARAVDQPCPRLHRTDAFGREDVGRLLGLGQMQRHDIGAGQKRLDRPDLLDAQFARALGRQEGIMGDHLHLQPERARRHHRPDIAAAEHAQRLARDLGAHETGFLPLAGARRGVRGWDLARQRHHHRDGVLGGGDRIAKGGVHHHDPARRGCRNVDIVDPDAGAPDHAQIGGAVDQFGGRLGGRADGEPVILADDPGQAVGILAEIGLEIRLDPAIAEDLHGGVGQLVGNQDLGHLTCSCCGQTRPGPLPPRCGWVGVAGGPGAENVLRRRRFRRGPWRRPSRARGSGPRYRPSRPSRRTRCAGPAARRGSR